MSLAMADLPVTWPNTEFETRPPERRFITEHAPKSHGDRNDTTDGADDTDRDGAVAPGGDEAADIELEIARLKDEKTNGRPHHRSDPTIARRCR